MTVMDPLKKWPAGRCFLLLFLLGLSNIARSEEKQPCYPLVNTDLPQFIVGYGSLMQEESKRENDPAAGDNYPIYLTGYNRGWIQQDNPVGFSTTWLGIRPEAHAKINAVYFKLSQANLVKEYDKREDTYCRIPVAPENIQFLTPDSPQKGQFWIYLTRNEEKHYPSRRFPIVQSYVDIFLSGCFHLEKKYQLPSFARDCVKTTSHWSDFWVNDRLHPRTAADDDPVLARIDNLLASELPEHFKNIKIE